MDWEAECDGPAFETLVLQNNIRALLAQRSHGATLGYWRTPTGLEVDFVVYGEGVFAAIEVKRKRTLASTDMKGLRVFAADYREASLYLFHGGDHEKVTADGIRLIPLSKALLRLETILFTPRGEAG